MGVEVNYIAVVLALLSSLVVGSIWYAKPVFGTMWMKMVGMTDAKASKGSGKAIAITLVVSFVTAYVLAHMAYLSNAYFGNSFMQDSLTTAFLVWLGFTAARFATHDAFEQRPLKLTVLSVGNEFVTIMVMGAIIGAFGV